MKEEEPLHEDLPEHNGAAQRDARVRPRRTYFERKKINPFVSGDGDGKEVWWGKAEVHAEDKVANCLQYHLVEFYPSIWLNAIILQIKSSNGQSQGRVRSWRGRPKWRFGRQKEGKGREGGGEESTQCGWGGTAKDGQVEPSASSSLSSPTSTTSSS